VQKLASEVDLEHSCGFFTLLNPHLAPSSSDDDEDDPTSPTSQPPPASADTTPADDSDTAASSPANGIKDKLSAEMLASELDALEDDASSGDHSELRMTGGEGEGKQHRTCQGRSQEVKGQESLVEGQWQLLDVYFGIPLFNPQLNKDVCQKVVRLQLCKEDRSVCTDSIFFKNVKYYVLTLWLSEGVRLFVLVCLFVCCFFVLFFVFPSNLSS
jgi:hypothetical protein